MVIPKRSYRLREIVTEKGTNYYISFRDGQGKFQELSVPYDFYMAFRRLELDNRKIENWDWRHREFSEIYDETLNRRALRLPKDVDEIIIEKEQAELLRKAITALPEIQRRRFLLYHEYDLNYYQIGAMEHCTPQAVRRSVIIAREKIKAQMKEYRCA
ncbi:sigma factor-like helix-turn-helix DNA-binding protein [Eubacteriales bacterium DFI.9.88]|nr:sigma factor-like helix-turn-helix DNA-binding protein [Eubacteriales bacterium DFI.9.88]